MAMAFGAAPSPSTAEVPALYREVAEAAEVPAQLLYALAAAESGAALNSGRYKPWPWTLNVAGQGSHFATHQAACEALTLALQETRVVDVGITQLNVRWQPQLFGAGKRFPHPCDALNPYANLEEAARLLRAAGSRAARLSGDRRSDLHAWLIDEVEMLPARAEVDEWMSAVDRSRADADRLTARMARLERRREAGNGDGDNGDADS